jgi:creatinine amidohydrolase
MEAAKMLWEYLREEEFEPMLKRTNGVCAISIGCIEKHGQHLPLGTDTLKGARILELAAEREEVCVFPRLYFGDLQGARAHKAGQGTHYGYVALSAELLLSLLREVCDEIGRNGFTKILLFSSHGGNNGLLANFLRAVTSEKKDYEVFSYFNKLVMPKDILEVINERGRSYFPRLTDRDIGVLEDYVAQGKYDGHAGFGETSFVMGTYPELVRLDRAEAESGLSTHRADFLMEKGIQWGKAWGKNYPNAYCGHPPIGVTQEIADAAVEIAVERAVEVLKVLKDDTLMNSIMEE